MPVRSWSDKERMTRTVKKGKEKRSRRRRTEPHSKLPNERSEVKGKCYRNKILSDSTNFLQICRPLIFRWWQKPFGMPTEKKIKIIPYDTGLGQYVIQLAFRYAYGKHL